MTKNLKEKRKRQCQIFKTCLYLIPYLDENAVKLQICFKTAFITVCLKQYILIVYFITEWLPCATMKDIMQMWAFGTYLIHFNIFFLTFLIPPFHWPLFIIRMEELCLLEIGRFDLFLVWIMWNPQNFKVRF